MENLIKMVTEKAGISETQAKSAVQAIVSFLKDKMPGGLGSQVESFINGKSAPGASEAEALKDKVGGFFK
jgi:hypothetical protein